MKKFLIAFSLLVLLLLSTLYLAVNSPYLIDRIARTYAPEYHFSYARILGNPLKGIVIEGLDYKGRNLARKIAIRINPYALLEKTLNVSKLHLYDVNVTVLEELIKDFSSPEASSPEPESKEEGSVGFPLGIALDNIRLSLLPFRRYGVKVDKEELSIDTIYYDAGRFNVGNLRQVADTSLGTVELEGTYHRRFLDVKMLAVEDLDLKGLTKLLKRLGALGGGENNATTTVSATQGESNASGETAGADGDIFLPKKIHAARLWLTLKPYDVDRKLHLEWAQLEGKELLIDLERLKVVEGKLTADLDSNMVKARLRLRVEKERATLEEGVVDGVDLQKILAWSAPSQRGKTPEGGKTPATTEANASASRPLDSLPFVPPSVAVSQLRVELLPGRFEGVDYRNTVLRIGDLRLDLHGKRLEAGQILADLDTPLMALHLDSAVDSGRIHVRSLRIDDVNLSRIEALAREKKGATNPAATEPNAAPRTKSPTQKRGITLPFLPERVEVDRARLRVVPYRVDSFDLRDAEVSLEKLRLDLSRLLLLKGGLRARVRSNLGRLDLQGRIRENRLVLSPEEGKGLILSRRLFETFGIPLRAEAFSPITIGGTIDGQGAKVDLRFHARKILAEDNASFNVDIDRSVTRARFDFVKGTLQVNEETDLSLPQAPKVRLRADLERSGSGALHYRGTIESGALKLGDPKIEKMLGKPRLAFEGGPQAFKATLDAGLFAGRFVSEDLKKGVLKLGTRRKLLLARYVKLPKKLAKAWVELEVRTPVDFAKPLPLTTQLALRSNLAQLDGKVVYDGNVSGEATVHFPKDSLLASFDPRLNLKAIDPLRIRLRQKGDLWKLALKSRKLKGAVEYAPGSDRIRGEIDLPGSRIKIGGEPKKVITATLISPSVKRTIAGLTDIYKVEVPRLDGDIALTLKIERLRRATLELKSKQFVPDDTARIKSPVKNIELLLGADLKRRALIVKNYHLETAGLTLFATRPSRLVLQKDRLVLEELWVNDSLKLQGSYDLGKRRGEVKGKAARFKVVHENARLDASIDLDAKIVGEKVDLKGKIVILGGKVHYDVTAKHYATDEDIVIIQHRKKDETSFFRNNVQITLYITAKKPLLFKQKDVYVELRPQLSVLKGYNADLQLLGSVGLAKGGYYIFEGKRFVLQPSSVNFTGKPTRPLLDIHLVYHRYSRTVYISVTGVATEPSLNFSSDPYMTRDQILSFILFDTTDSGDNAGNMLSMVGGGIAKSILGNLGLKVDTLIVTQEGFEVGKKITDKITVLYDQKAEEPKVIVRIQHSKRTETDLSIGSESQSVDIIYKREF